MDKRAEAEARIAETLAELGAKALRPLRWYLMVRTEPVEERTAGGLWLPPKLASFYGPLPHRQILEGLVLAAGPDAALNQGDRVAFQRLHFSRWCQMADQTYVGWVDSNQLLGIVEEERDEHPEQDCRSEAVLPP